MINHCCWLKRVAIVPLKSIDDSAYSFFWIAPHNHSAPILSAELKSNQHAGCWALSLNSAGCDVAACFACSNQCTPRLVSTNWCSRYYRLHPPSQIKYYRERLGIATPHAWKIYLQVIVKTQNAHQTVTQYVCDSSCFLKIEVTHSQSIFFYVFWASVGHLGVLITLPARTCYELDSTTSKPLPTLLRILIN